MGVANRSAGGGGSGASGACETATRRRRAARHAGGPRCGMTGWERTRRRGLVVLAATALSLLFCSPAVALVARGHILSSTFEGAGAHTIDAPTGIAVSDATGDVYVVDRSKPHEQVERFRPDGKGGYVFVSAFAVKSPSQIAVDNSTSASDPSRGDVYVVGATEEGVGVGEHGVLIKYSPSEGRVVYRKTIFHHAAEELALEEIYGVAVDASGGLWVYWGEEGNVSGFDSALANRWQPSLTKELGLKEKVACRARPGFAVAPHDEYFYVAHEQETPLEECPEEETTPARIAKFSGTGQLITAGLDSEATTGIAVDPVSGEAYADNVGQVAALTAGGALIQRFGAGALGAGGGLAVDSDNGAVYVLEPSEGKVAVFSPEGPGAPTVDSVYAQSLTPSSERLVTEIDPKGLATTYHFQYGTVNCALDPSGCTDVPALPGAGLGSGFGDQMATQELSGLQPNTTYFYRVIAQNSGGTAESEQSAQAFFTTLPSGEGVLPDHRVWEMVSPPVKHGATIEPISREGALIQSSLDGNSIAWTASSPVTGEAEGNRRPEPVQVISSRNASEGWSSKDISTSHDRGEGVTPGAATEYRFFSPDLSLALVQPQVPNEPLENPPLAPEATEKTIYRRNDTSGAFEPLMTPKADTAGTNFGGKLEYGGATPDLSHVVFGSEVPLTTGAGGRNLYEWESGMLLKLVSLLPGPQGKPASEPTLGDQGRNVRGAVSSDGSRVFWTNGGGDEGPLFMRDTVKGETIQVNAAQGVAEATEEEISERLDEVHFQAASSDGSKVFFTDTWPLTKDSMLEPRAFEETVTEGEASRPAGRPTDLYEFDVQTGKLTDLTPASVGEQGDVLGTLPGASEDGSYVYFVANGVLAPGAKAGNCPRTTPLVPHPQAICNLYLSEADPEHPGSRRTKLIARLSFEDAPDWGAGNSPLPGDLGGVTSQVSASGRYLAFMSARELTGYNNVDANPEAKGAHDEEVFLYDQQAGRIVCASCNPSGASPHGVFDTEDAGEGLGLVVDRPETWLGHWLAGSIPGWTLFGLNNPVAEHQSRYLSNQGRLFFNSADPLVSQVTARSRPETVSGKALSVGVENVYEYESDGEGSCRSQPGCVALISSGTSPRESAFLDASETGSDVFFLTAAPLLAQDSDSTLDIYDARVCGTTETQPCLPAKPPPPPACSGEECRPAFVPEESLAMPASSSFSGPGNTSSSAVLSNTVAHAPVVKPPTTAQQLTKALKACRKLKQRHKRKQCEARARKRYKSRGARSSVARSPHSRHGGRK